MPLKVGTIPSLPPKVIRNDIGDNGKLVPDDQIELLKSFYDSDPQEGRYTVLKQIAKMRSESVYGIAPMIGEGYSILKIADPEAKRFRYIAIYEGEKKGKMLGKGAFGKFKIGQDLETGEFVGIKSQNIRALAKNRFDPRNEKTPGEMRNYENQIFGDIKAELENLKKLGSTAFIFKRSGLDKSKNTVYQGILIMPLLSGKNLESVVKDKTLSLSTGRWLDIGINAIKAVKKIHQAHLLHRDIKPDNLICNLQTSEVGVVDFGLAANMNAKGKIPNQGVMGTDGFIAPEIENAKSYQAEYNEKTEVFALGMTIARIYGLTYDDEEGHLRIKDKGINNRITDKTLGNAALNYLKMMTNKNPDKRPTLSEAVGFFETLKSQCVETLSHIRKTGILDVKEYRESSDEDKKKLHAALSHCDEIFLFDQEKRGMGIYLDIRKDLMDENIIVSDKILYAVEEHKNDLIKSIPHEKGIADNNIRSFFYVTLEPSELKLRGEVAIISAADKPIEQIHGFLKDNHLFKRQNEMVRQSLQTEMARLEKKYGKLDKNTQRKVVKNQIVRERLQEMMVYLNLHMNKNESFESLQHSLKTLESKMTNTSAVKKLLAKFISLDVRSTGEKYISKIGEQIKEQEKYYSPTSLKKNH